MDINMLRAKIDEKNMTIAAIAKEIGMHRATFYRKLSEEGFTIREANLIVKVLGLSQVEAVNIFFTNKVA